jgi:hypothetical protein
MITTEDIKKLKYYAKDFALMMDDEAIERVIVEFVEVKNIRDNYRRDHMKK